MLMKVLEVLVGNLKKILLKPTNTLPFMFGLFIGMTIVSPDLVYNSMITAVSGSTFHVIKAIALSI